MIALMQKRMFMQFSQYQILKGKYLVPAPPKRSSSAYVLYSIEAGKKVEQKSIAERSKVIGQQWKELPDAEKQLYSKKAEEIKVNKDKESEVYGRKYRWPFTTISARNLIMQEFYKSNKYTGIKEGQEALKQFIEKLTPEQKETYQKKAAELKAEK